MKSADRRAHADTLRRSLGQASDPARREMLEAAISDALFEAQACEDWELWLAQHEVRDPRPEPSTPDGHPSGWSLAARRVTEDRYPKAVYLYRMRDTGWALIISDPTDLSASATVHPRFLRDLTDAFIPVESGRDSESQATADAYNTWLSGFLLSLYDLDDPAEASAHFLAALSGEFNPPPRAALLAGDLVQ